MNKESRSNTVLIVVLVSAGCLVLLCGAVVLLFFLFGFAGFSSFTVEEAPVETTTLSTAQLEQCREVMAILPGVELEGEYFLYTPGFLDDSLECHLQARADSLAEVFDLSLIDPTLTTDQQIAPGRHLRLNIELIEPGLYRIEGFWYQT